MVDIQSPTAEIRRGKKERRRSKKIEITGQKYSPTKLCDDAQMAIFCVIFACPIPQGGHKK